MKKKIAQVILPTGAGKSFVALAQMQKYATQNPNEKMLYLAPQDEILNQIKETGEEKRLKILMKQYDNEEIDEEDISDEDIDKLIKMYEKETEELNADTEKRKIHIAQMLKELRNGT